MQGEVRAGAGRSSEQSGHELQSWEEELSSDAGQHQAVSLGAALHRSDQAGVHDADTMELMCRAPRRGQEVGAHHSPVIPSQENKGLLVIIE